MKEEGEEGGGAREVLEVEPEPGEGEGGAAMEGEERERVGEVDGGREEEDCEDWDVSVDLDLEARRGEEVEPIAEV